MVAACSSSAGRRETLQEIKGDGNRGSEIELRQEKGIDSQCNWNLGPNEIEEYARLDSCVGVKQAR